MEKASSLIAENRRYLRAWMRDWEKRVRRALAEHEGEGSATPPAPR